MDERIFRQLDVLERGARLDPQCGRQHYNDSSAEYSAYDGYDRGCDAYGRGNTTLQGYQQAEEDMVDQRMVLDSFEERLLRQPDHDSRHGQAALGRARLSLMPDNAHPQEQAPARAFDLSRFALEPGFGDQSSSPPFKQPLPSSPAFNASQRRPAAYELGRDTHRAAHPPVYEQYEQQSAYQPIDTTQLEKDVRHLNEGTVRDPGEDFRPSYAVNQPTSRPKHINVGPPVVQGINLISTHELPDRFRSIFPFPLFNAVQSKSFDAIYRSNDNFVLSAPTGSGKTAVLELAICRLINGFASGSYKIVYQAPTKSLCSERQRDWQNKFGLLDLQCAELTGDTDHAQLRNVQHASIIVTTPEKWDSMTRKWKDHQKLMQMVKLFLIDEVHILKDDRGATLEAVVSRMKSVGSDVRFVALSATVPNSQDIATWLGNNPMNQQVPAVRERFGEEFRPVKLQKHVCGYQTNGNDFAFDKTLNAKLPDVITKWSQRKPIMVFCFTRNSCVETAKLLATWWASKGPKERYWSAPRHRLVVGENDLRDTISSGVAFHHAGLQPQDRTAVEKGYLEGDINVICCTSTLAIGVNLPCHMAIIKNTITYQSSQAGGCKEYSDLEIMQMLGRAGRPQFDDSAVAVIMTRAQRAQHYEKMITGQEILESCLHRNLIDHLNAEIGLGTITNAASAKKWLSGTFLYVRLKENPEHYKLEGDSPGGNLDERLETICRKGIAMLEENDLVQALPKLHCTEFGDAMARYYLHFDTMKVFLAMPPKANISEILSAVAQAAEFRDVRFRGGEKGTYKELNKNTSIKFPIPVNIDLPAHKVSLIIQAVLGVTDFPTEDYKHKVEFGSAKATIFQHAHRLVRCIVDCQLYLDDAVSTRNALMLARSLGAQVWDDSPLHMKQLEGVGLVSVRKLAVAGIKSIEDIETADAHRLEHVLSRNPPYGAQLQEKARAFPKIRISLKTWGEPVIKKGAYVTVRVKAEIGFLNERVPETFQRRAVYVCMLAETSDGHTVHFARISAKKLNKGQEVMFSANLTNASQIVRAYAMCDEIAGSARQAILKPEIPAIAFPLPKTSEEMNKQRGLVAHAPNTSKRRASASKARDSISDEFDDAGIDDADFVFAETGGFVDIDDLDAFGHGVQTKQKKQKIKHSTQANDDWEPQQLANRKWACNHTCKDKTACKHLCCRDGLDKKPKPPKQKGSKKQAAEPDSDPKQTQLSIGPSKKSGTTSTPGAKMAEKTQVSAPRKKVDTREIQDLNRLHNSIKSSTAKVPLLSKGDLPSKTSHASHQHLSFLGGNTKVEDGASSDYSVDTRDPNEMQVDYPDLSTHPASRMSPPRDRPSFADTDDDMLDAGYGGGTESQHTQPLLEGLGDGHIDFSSYTDEPKIAAHNKWQTNELDHEHDDTRMTMVAPRKPTSREAILPLDKTKNLFVGYSTDSAEQEGLGHNRPQHEDAGIADVSKFFASTQHAKGPSRTPSAQLHQGFEQAVQPAIDNTFLAEAVGEEAQVEPSDIPDDLEAWFKAEFGTEQFNYVG